MALKFVKNIVPRKRKKRKKKIISQNNEADLGNILLGGDKRLINKDGSFNIQRKGSEYYFIYKELVSMSWSRFFLLVTLFFFVINAIFACLYATLGVGSLSGLHNGSFLENFAQAFFFSIQTFTTVGYGHINPHSLTANIIASIDAFVGLMTLAMTTGLIFVRFSKPRSHIHFSEKMIIAPYKNDMKSLQFRIVNSTDSKILDMEAKVTMTWLQETDGIMRRKFEELTLELDAVYLFPLNWTIIHPIDENSPFFHRSLDDLIETHAEVLIMIRGFDETYSRLIHNSWSYNCKELIYGAKFISMYETHDNITTLHLDKLNETEKYFFKED